MGQFRYLETITYETEKVLDIDVAKYFKYKANIETMWDLIEYIQNDINFSYQEGFIEASIESYDLQNLQDLWEEWLHLAKNKKCLLNLYAFFLTDEGWVIKEITTDYNSIKGSPYSNFTEDSELVCYNDILYGYSTFLVETLDDDIEMIASRYGIYNPRIEGVYCQRNGEVHSVFSRKQY